MIASDFGRFEDPVVLFGGAYSNLDALEALAGAAEGRPVIGTGDIVGYCGQPAETVARVRQLGWPSVAGNCERQIAEGSSDCGCGFETGSVCDLLSQGWYPFASGEIGEEQRRWMAGLPGCATFVQGGLRFAVVHGGFSHASRFLWPSSSEDDFVSEIALVEEACGPVDGVIAGHSGVAFQRRIGRHRWINAGAIGLPPHDGRPETRYAVLDDGDVVFERLAYDHAKARRAMEARGLAQGYHETLTTGIWPSEDILPPELRR
ncbi:MAG: metallophosphoesterase family protein [Paracoccaceae bacterium]|nr:metallophosphoesterase family protein [Paracoccaceae bacterium]